MTASAMTVPNGSACVEWYDHAIEFSTLHTRKSGTLGSAHTYEVQEVNVRHVGACEVFCLADRVPDRVPGTRPAVMMVAQTHFSPVICL